MNSNNYIGYPIATISYTGTVQWQPDPEPFGDVISEQSVGPGHDPLIRYPGQWRVDPVLATTEPNFTTLFYNTRRWYNPSWGRYTQSDPIFEDLRTQFQYAYSYASNNPQRFIDPLGLRRFGMGGRFCLGKECKTLPPIRILGEDAPAFVPPPECSGDCVDADAVYGPKGVVKIRDFGTCWMRCNPDGSPRDIKCGFPPPIFFPCGTPLPEGWPDNDLCGD